MQTLHDVVISDPVMAQLICDKINQENDTKYTIKTFRERIQRWLVNGRYAKIILEGYDLVLPLEVDIFWIVWHIDICRLLMVRGGSHSKN